MRPPSPRTCFRAVIVIGGGLAIWDGICLSRHWGLPPSQLHQLAVGLMVMAGVTGALGYWIDNLVKLGGDMERARRGDKPTTSIASAPNVHQLHGRPRPSGQEQLRRRAE